MDPVEENHSLRADRFKQQVVRLDAYTMHPDLETRLKVRGKEGSRPKN
jgi:hypothetical protein